MLEEMLAHLARARDDDAVRVLVALLDRPHGAVGGRRRPRAARRGGRACGGWQLFAELYDELTGFPKPTIAACHGACVGGGAEIAVACDLRVGGSNLRLRFPGAALGVPVGPARLVTLCGLSVAKYLLLSSKEVDRRRGAALGARRTASRPPPRTEDAALELAAQVAAHPPEAVARLKRMLHRWDDVEERSRDEGEGQVEWQRSGPGLPFAD